MLGLRNWLVVVVLMLAIVGVSGVSVGAKARHRAPKVKRCPTGQLTTFKLRNGKQVGAKPGKRPPKGARVVCVVLPSRSGSTRALVTTAEVGYAFSQLPQKTRRQFQAIVTVMGKLISALERNASPVPSVRARAAAGRALAATAGSSNASSGDASGTQSSQGGDINTPDSAGFDGRGTASSNASNADGSVTMTLSDSKHYQNDKCPGADGKVRNGIYHQSVAETTRLKPRKGGRGTVSLDASVSGTYEAEVGDDGSPTQLTLILKGEIRTHKVVGNDYDFGVVDWSTTVTVDLKDPSGPWTASDPHFTGRGTVDPQEAQKLTKSMIQEAVRDTSLTIEKQPWQTPNACAQLHVSADQQTAPRGGQIKLVFSAAAHDGSPLSTSLTITTSCPGTFSDSHQTTDGSGIATVTLSDPNSQWKDSSGACVHASMQTRAGKGEADRVIPAQPSSKDHVTGTLTISVTYHDTCDTGQNLNETDNWTGTGHIDESYDPTITDPSAYIHSSTLTFGGTWSSGGCSDPSTGQTSGTDQGTSQASVTGQDGISDDNGGVSAYWDSPSQGRLEFYVDWPVNGTDNCQDLGTSAVSGSLGTRFAVPIPPGGSGTINVDKTLAGASGEDQWTNGWGPSCSGTPPDPATNVHITGTLTVHRAS